MITFDSEPKEERHTHQEKGITRNMFTFEEFIQWRRDLTCFSPEEQHEFDERLSKDYDGYMGQLAPWMTDEHKILFLNSREQEFSGNKNLGYDTKIIEAKVIEAINSWCDFHHRKHTQPPWDLGENIRNLGWLKFLSSFRAEEILNGVIGEGARKALVKIKQGKRGEGKKDSKGKLRRSMELICQEINSKSYPVFIEKIEPVKEGEKPEDNKFISNLCEKLKDRLEIHHFELDKKYLYFKYRDNTQCKKTIGTIRNILSDIKLN